MVTQESQIIISAVDRATSEIAKVRAEMERVGKTANNQQNSFKAVATQVAKYAAGYLSLKTVVLDSIKAYEESQDAISKLDAILKSTGFSAGVTRDELTEMASSLQNVTRFSDETVMSAQSILLTFTNIKKDVFPQVTEMALNMATVFGQDVSSAAMQLGKAMQDPVQGASALRRVGVSLNAEQLKQIENFAKTNDIAKAQAIIMKELQREVGGAARAMGETFAGKVAIIRNQIGELQEVIGKQLVRGIMGSFGLLNQSANEISETFNNVKIQVQLWSSALINGFTFTIRALWNLVQSIGRIIATPFALAYGAALDAVQGIKNLINGDFTTTTENFDKAWEVTAGGVKTDIEDMKSAFENAFVAVDQTFDDTGESAKQMGKTIGDGYSQIGDGAGDMADKIKEATKKVRDLKNEMKTAISEAKADIKKFKDEFKEETIKREGELASSIGQVIVDKEKEKAELQGQLKKADTDSERSELNNKIKAIDDFFAKHQGDMSQYAKAIVDQRYRMSLDEIETLKLQHAEEEAERKKDYEKQLKELKNHLKEVKAEYKRKLKELKDEIKSEGLDNIKINVTLSSSKSSSKKRAVGGSVMRGEEYTVGENGPETFVPDASGKIVQTGQGGNPITQYFSFDMRGMSVHSPEELVALIQQTISRKNELNSIGSQTL